MTSTERGTIDGQMFSGIDRRLFFDSAEAAEKSQLTAYVIDELPGELRKLVKVSGEKNEKVDVDFEGLARLAKSQEGLLDVVEAQVQANQDPYTAELIQLDLLFLLGGYVPAKGKAFEVCPPRILALLDEQNRRFGIPSRMGYEQIIDLNVKEFLEKGIIRVFSDGADASHEIDFYLGHYFAEPDVLEAAKNVRQLVLNPEDPNKGALLQDSHSKMARFTLKMQEYHHGLSKSSFSYFRSFLDTYPDKTRNASGAFMPGVQMLELALHSPTPEYERFLDESWPYFPRASQPVLAELRSDSESGTNLLQMVIDGIITLSAEEKQQLKGIFDQFTLFRKIHLGATKKQIPGAFPPGKLPGNSELANFGERDIMEESATPGSAGFNVINVLGNSVFRLMQSKELLDGLEP